MTEIIKFNVGGQKFEIMESTLACYKDSLLYRMTKTQVGSQKDKDGYYFIEKNPEYFAKILDFYRGNNFEMYSDTRLKAEFDYYVLPYPEFTKLLDNAKHKHEESAVRIYKPLEYTPNKKYPFVFANFNYSNNVPQHCGNLYYWPFDHMFLQDKYLILDKLLLRFDSDILLLRTWYHNSIIQHNKKFEADQVFYSRIQLHVYLDTNWIKIREKHNNHHYYENNKITKTSFPYLRMYNEILEEMEVEICNLLKN